MMPANVYEPVNTAWPAELPPITRTEAQCAAYRLSRHFYPREGAPQAGRALAPRWVRRCWITTRPLPSTVQRGWWSLVHDVSHRVYRVTHRQTKSHGEGHARLEAEMIAYVLTQGWLTGGLRPAAKPKATREDRRAERLRHAEAMLATWQARVKVAERRVRFWGRRVRARAALGKLV